MKNTSGKDTDEECSGKYPDRRRLMIHGEAVELVTVSFTRE